MENIKKTMLEELSNVKDLKNLSDLKVKYLGKKGIITELYSKMKEIPNEEKKEYGRKINEIKNLFNKKYEELKNKFFEEELNEKLENESIDISLPSTKIVSGAPSILEKLIDTLNKIANVLNVSVFDFFNFFDFELKTNNKNIIIKNILLKLKKCSYEDLAKYEQIIDVLIK